MNYGLELEGPQIGKRLGPELDVATDAEREVYESLANSETQPPARGLSGSQALRVIPGLSLSMRDAVLNIDPVGNVICKRVIGDYIYGTCKAGPVEYNVIRHVCFKLKADDARVLNPGLQLIDGVTPLVVKCEEQGTLNDEDIQLIRVMVTQKVGTDPINRSLKSVGAEVKSKVFRDERGGLFSKGETLSLTDLLLRHHTASE